MEMFETLRKAQSLIYVQSVTFMINTVNIKSAVLSSKHTHWDT